MALMPVEPAGRDERTQALHFGGPRGALALMILLPALLHYMWICMRHNDGALLVPRSLGELWALVRLAPLPTPRAVLMFGAWMTLQVLLQIFAPGPMQEGTPLQDGTRLRYRMNGWFSLWFSLGLFVLFVATGWLAPALLCEELGPLLATANLFAFACSFFLYFYGKRRGAAERASGIPIYDYFMGTARHPRIDTFDLKQLCVARPGLIGWLVLDLALAATQHQRHGTVTVAMALVCALHLLYVADHFYHEPATLTTLGIQHENLGWMLCWGELAWAPFASCLPAYYLLAHPRDLSPAAAAAIAALSLTGYYIFRSANLQKHRFRTDPAALIWGRKPTSIRTHRGAPLLTSGWWGMARHANYLGELIMALAWCLPCGFAHSLPYLPFLSLSVLLISRERRDHAICQAKYDGHWESYCRKVPWRILPGVY